MRLLRLSHGGGNRRVQDRHLGGGTAADDEQAGEDEGPGWRRWKEWTKRLNLRRPTQERGGRDDDEEDEEQGKLGVRGRGKTRSRQGDGEEEDEEGARG